MKKFALHSGFFFTLKRIYAIKIAYNLQYVSLERLRSQK